MLANYYITLPLAFAAGLLLGLLLMWLIARARKERLQTAVQRLPHLEAEIKGLQDEKIQLHEEIASLKAYRQADEERLTWLDNARESMRETFLALSGETLRSSSEDILKAHKEQLHNLVQPLDKVLQEMRQNLREREGKREGAYGELKENLGQLFQVNRQLQLETGKLSHALKAGAQQRGRWAEFQLQRLAELAGLKERVDFDLQKGEYIIMRSEPSTACYFINQLKPYKTLLNQIFPPIYQEFPDHKYFLLVRNSKQEQFLKTKLNKYSQENNLIITRYLPRLDDLCFYSGLVISGGGTIVRESSLLNVPSIEFFPGETAPQEHFLKNNGFPLEHIRKIDRIVERSIQILNKGGKRERFSMAFKEKIEKLFETVARWLFRNPIKVLLISFLFIGYLVYQIPSITIDTSSESMLHENDASLLVWKRPSRTTKTRSMPTRVTRFHYFTSP